MAQLSPISQSGLDRLITAGRARPPRRAIADLMPPAPGDPLSTELHVPTGKYQGQFDLCRDGLQSPTYFRVPVDKVDPAGFRFYRFASEDPSGLCFWRVEFYGVQPPQQKDATEPAGQKKRARLAA